ncbi:EMILIN-3 [Myotis lucifugus]|uniref:EMILIN-3 n=1 Tax=Myotis lucifugus TaxID=59463 RepID=UPI000CCBE23B|nr:EMILIN-3 [Myotis lucifugus]
MGFKDQCVGRMAVACQLVSRWRRGCRSFSGPAQARYSKDAILPCRALCAYVVHRNVTCVLQEGAESYIKAEYRQCGWGPKCPGTVTYRTVLRPKYKVGYKKVTELSWRCCPGLTGEGCPEHLTDHGAAPPQSEPEPQIPSGQLSPGSRPPPSRATPSPYGESAHGDPTKAASLRMHQSLDDRELALRRELSQLGTRLQGLSVAGRGSCCSQLALVSARMDSLESNLQAVTEVQRGHGPSTSDELTRLSAAMLEGGVDGFLEGLETLNGTESGGRGCCQGVKEGGGGGGGFRTLLEERVHSLEERLLTLAGELSRDSTPPGRPAGPLVQTELAVLEQRLVSLETSCTPSTTSAVLNNLVAEVKAWQSQMEVLLRQVASHTALLQQLNGTVAEVQGQLAEATGSSLQGEITLLKVNLNSVSKSLTGLSDSVSQYSDAFLATNTSLDERERKVEAEVHAIQEQVSSQGSRLRAGHRQVLSLRGELEQLKAGVADVAGGLSRCQDTAQELQLAVGHFDQRVAQVEGVCGKLGPLAADLNSLPTDSLRPREGLWGHVDQLNRTLARHAQDIARLRDDLLDCQAQLAEQGRPGRAN